MTTAQTLGTQKEESETLLTISTGGKSYNLNWKSSMVLRIPAEQGEKPQAQWSRKEMQQDIEMKQKQEGKNCTTNLEQCQQWNWGKWISLTETILYRPLHSANFFSRKEAKSQISGGMTAKLGITQNLFENLHVPPWPGCSLQWQLHWFPKHSDFIQWQKNPHWALNCSALKSPTPFSKQDIWVRRALFWAGLPCYGEWTRELLLQSHQAQKGYGQGCLPLCPDYYKDFLMQVAQVSISDIIHASLSLPSLSKFWLFKYIHRAHKAKSILHLSCWKVWEQKDRGVSAGI